MKMLAKILRFSLLVIPSLFIYLGIKFGDFFYFILSTISLIFWVLLLLPKLLAKQKLLLPKIKFRFLKIKLSKIPEPEFISVLKNKTAVQRFLERKYSPLLLILVLSNIIFVYLAVFRLPISTEKNILWGFYLSQLSLLRQYWFYFIVGIILAVYFLILSNNKSKRQLSKIKAVSKSVTTVLSILIFSLAVSFLTTYIFAIGHANFLTLKQNVNPSEKIIWGEKDVLNRLKSTSKAPRIVGVEKGIKRTLIALTLEEDNKSEFYKQKVITNIPDSLLVFLNVPRESLIMSGNHLLITEIKKNEVEAISPTVGRLLVKQHLKPKYIKDEPEVKVLGRQEYLKYRDDKINEQLEEIDSILSRIQNVISVLYANIQEDKRKVETNKSGLSSSIANRDSFYNYCKTAGYQGFYTGTFYRYYSDEECEANRREWDAIIVAYQKNIADWEAVLRKDQSQLVEFQELENLYQTIRPLVESQKDSAIQELGLFEPEKSVKVVLESTSNKAVIDYLATLVHEYLHYASYVSEERQLPSFFEEGLTEYFSRRIIEKEVGVSTNLGYPMIVKIIQEITEDIPESELEDIYFTKDKTRLISLLNNAYGSNFYDDSEFYFFAISYVKSSDALKFANNIMFKIGGNELKEEDLISSYSEFK